MATVTSHTQTRPAQSRGKSQGKTKSGPNNSHRRGGQQGQRGKKEGEKVAPAIEDDTAASEGDADVCWICAEPVKYYAVSECNHRTCHVCSLRLRALYKKNECTFCKEPQPAMVFTISPQALFLSFEIERIEFKDTKLSVFFETQEMMEETLLLLRFNCPDPQCDFIGNGWSDIKLHARASHGKLMCDLCIRHKKVFAHEHTLYPPNILPLHLPSILTAARPSRPGKSKDKDQVEGGVHPFCEFCRECFFGDDELYRHMREAHEECFICKRNDIRDQYFTNYAALETHFTRDHFPCPHPTCLARKFVVFNSALDLKAHAVEEHGGELGKSELRDARRIEPAWDSGGHGRGRGRERDRERARDRDRDGPPPSSSQQTQTQQQPARPPPTGGRRREGFGSQLTTDGETSTPTPARTPSPSRDVDPATAERHSAFISRLASMAPNPTTALPAARAAIRSFRASESSARDLISTLYSIVDSRMEAASSVVNALVDLFDNSADAEQREAILSAWRDFEVSQRQQFPDLVPTSVGGGYAGITSGRVLNAKHATATRQGRAVWDRVAQAAQASNAQQRFPALSNSSSVPGGPSKAIPGQRNTPWSASASGKPTGFAASSSFVPPPIGGPTPAVVVPRSESIGNSKRRAASQAIQRIVPRAAYTTEDGSSASQGGGAWGGGANAPPAPPPPTAEAVDEPVAAKKKGKGKQKQTLFTLGAFPS
ncbi:RING-type domain-containing protein [Mycena indigotica]|uniref:RING-type E3 ubiquitin transferase n=1 Tax=Mycena indigotica TaxID=2126181 RepID=A0A8H6VSU2_9AGAR|nr:RING-type domain-containing protein [Mycena indigotica]KAF7292712.1 RING-type domain-containing protein [Mycena indigotica]